MNQILIIKQGFKGCSLGFVTPSELETEMSDLSLPHDNIRLDS